jgi:transposase
MKPYSSDFREKILEAYLQKEGSIRQLAQRFNVSARFVWDLIRRFRHTGSYVPKPHGGGNPPCIAPSQQAMISALVKQYPDATLQELCRHVEENCQVNVSKSRMQRTRDLLQLTRKKRLSTRPSVTQTTAKGNVRSIKRK